MAETITNNFYEGSQKVDHIDKQENHYHYYNGKPNDIDQQDGNNDSLIRFILNNDERVNVLRGMKTCEDTGQLAAFLRRISIEEIMTVDDIRSADFHRTIRPLLQFDTTERAIKEAILKQFK